MSRNARMGIYMTVIAIAAVIVVAYAVLGIRLV